MLDGPDCDDGSGVRYQKETDAVVKMHKSEINIASGSVLGGYDFFLSLSSV